MEQSTVSRFDWFLSTFHERMRNSTAATAAGGMKPHQAFLEAMAMQRQSVTITVQ